MRFVRFFAVAAAALLLCACSESLRVATFNVRGPYDDTPNTWEERAPRIRKIIEDNDFDLFGVQEAFRKMQIESIAEVSGYAYITGKPIHVVAGYRDAIFYRTSRLELLDQGIFTLSDTPEVFHSKSWGNYEARYAVWAKFRDKRTGKEFFHFNTHLDHKSAPAKVNGIILIMTRAKEQAKGLPVIVTGDFNGRPDTEVYAEAAKRMKDTFTITETPSTGSERTFTAFRYPEHIGGKLDYVFVSDGIRVLSHRTVDTLIDGKFPSDHFPVMAKLILE